MFDKIILTEKPSAALKIAQALTDKKIKKKEYQKVPYYEIEYNNKKILVLCAVGHLYNVAEKDKGNWVYPFFDYTWKESYLTQKSAAFSKKYLDTIKKLNDQKAEVFMATDKDLEGEILGFNIIRFALKRKDAKRMEFSTMTSKDLKKAFENPKQHLDFPLIESGEARHILDFLWGLNLSRALTLAVKNAGMFKILSSGRVQGPALKILAERELEIQKFKPEPYWELEAINSITFSHKKGKFFDKKEVDKIYDKIKSEKSAAVIDLTKKEFYQEAPAPFDLTSLQLESYRVFGITPKETLSISQELYTNAHISYPRTSSNQLPESLNYKEIISGIGKQKQYESLAKILLSRKELKPNNGKKTDPAHPCFTEEAEVSLNPHGILKFRDIINDNKWNYDQNVDSFYSLPKYEVKVLAYDGNNIVSSHITKIWKTSYNKKMLFIKCSNGSIVKTTLNHKFYTLTKNGFEYIEAKKLIENTYIAHLPNTKKFEDPSKKVIITEEDFIKTYNKEQQVRINKYFKNKNGFRLKPSEVSTIEKLRKINILPIRYGTKEAELLAKLVGFIFGDGHLNYYKATANRNFYPKSSFLAERVDLEKIKNELLQIGINVDANIRNHKNTNKIQVLNINNSILNRLLIVLGAPQGDKITKNYSIPTWILKGDKPVKKAFLSTYFGNECSKPRVHYKNKCDLKSLYIGIDKLIDIKESAFNLYSQIKYILEKDFSIITSKIKQKNRNKRRKKDDKLTCSTLLSIKNNRNNLLKFFLEIGFSFCSYKEELAKKATAYLIYRNALIQERIIKKNLAKRLKQEGKKFSEISSIIDVPTGTIKGWINYNKSDKELHISGDMPKFDNFNFFVGDESWTKIDKISEVDGPEYVYDVEIDKYHTFFVNGFLVHNCIHPTGEIPNKLKDREKKVYDLIVKRTLATFADKAKRETVTINTEIKKEPFVARGSKTIEKGWHLFYEPYLKLEEIEMPNLKKNDKINIKKINKLEKETSPPRRFTEASIIKELEHRNLGTKATRAQIIEALYQRDYVKEKSIEVTDLGLKTIEILKKYSPEIIDEDLTRHFEEEMEQIREEKIKKEEVIDEAVDELTKLLKKFKQQEKNIGAELIESLKETREKASVVGPCFKCGKELRILYSKRFKSYFVACSGYPKCKTTYSLTRGLPKPTDKKCPSCNYPLVQIIRQGTRPFDYCIFSKCPKKLAWIKENKEKVEEFRKKLKKQS